MTHSEPIKLPKISRRQSLKLGAAATAAGVVAAGKLVPSAQAQGNGNVVLPPRTTPFVVPLRVYRAKTPASVLTPPAGAVAGAGECGRATHQRYAESLPQKFYKLNIKPALHSFHPELPNQTIWGYDGQMPGPTFVERYGVPITVRIYNDLPPSAVGFGSPEFSTHLHNSHSASESDGYPGDYYSATQFGPTLTHAGGYKDHHYPNWYAGYDDPRYHSTGGDPREALGTLWYHDHRLDFTAPNVYRGLAGFYLLFDDIDSGNERDFGNPKALRLPSGVGQFDIPLVFQDIVVDASGYVSFDQFATNGILGNKFCVNGKIQPYFKVQRRKYRFRMLDASISRFYEFYLVDGNGVNQPFDYIANDGNLLPAPLRNMKKVHLAPAERGDIVIDFSKFPLYTRLYLVNRLVHLDGRGPEDATVNIRDANGFLTGAGTQMMRFDIDSEPSVPDVSQVPNSLRELPPINLAEVVQNRTWEFDRVNAVWTVNGQLFDAVNPIASPRRGTAEIWTLQGRGGWHHPVHIHFEEGRILSRNGLPPPPHEAGRKDVYVLEPNDVVVVFLRFRDFMGKYVMHCHNLTHEDHAMMVHWDVVP